MVSLRARTARSVRRSRLRDEAIRFVERRRSATLHELSRALGSSPTRVRALLYGGDEDFAAGLGLVRIGVLRPFESRFGIEYELTARGRREAAILRDARRARRRV